MDITYGDYPVLEKTTCRGCAFEKNWKCKKVHHDAKGNGGREKYRFQIMKKEVPYKRPDLHSVRPGDVEADALGRVHDQG